MNELKKSIEITNQTNSKVLSVTVTTDNAYVASDIANSIGVNFEKKMKKLMNANNVTIVNEATPNTDPVSPNKKIYAIVGFIVGGGIGLTIVLLKEIFDISVKDGEFLTEELGIVNLGAINHVTYSDKDYRVVTAITKDRNVDSENYRRV